MKQLFSILILALCFAIQTKAQDTTSTQPVKKRSYIDTVANATQVIPKEFNSLTGDTVYQVTVSVFGITANSTLPANSYVQCFDAKGKKVYEKNVAIPYSVLSTWGVDDSPLVDFVLADIKLRRKQ